MHFSSALTHLSCPPKILELAQKSVFLPCSSVEIYIEHIFPFLSSCLFLTLSSMHSLCFFFWTGCWFKSEHPRVCMPCRSEVSFCCGAYPEYSFLHYAVFKTLYETHLQEIILLDILVSRIHAKPQKCKGTSLPTELNRYKYVILYSFLLRNFVRKYQFVICLLSNYIHIHLHSVSL